MKKFLVRVAAALCLIAASYGICCVYLIKTRGIVSEIFYTIHLAEEETGYTSVILGDSVARQIFHPENQQETEKIYYLATNQAITGLGNYILLEHFLEKNPQVEQVYYIVNPCSLSSDMSISLALQYFVYPFYTQENIVFISEDMQRELEDKFGAFLLEHPLALCVLCETPALRDAYLAYLQGKPENQEKGDGELAISDVTADSLHKMIRLCEERNVHFSVLPTPVADTAENRQLDSLGKSIGDNGLLECMGDYADQIEYYGEKDFEDGTHLTMKSLEENRKSIITQMGIIR